MTKKRRVYKPRVVGGQVMLQAEARKLPPKKPQG
jgi:hypothetical protein